LTSLFLIHHLSALSPLVFHRNIFAKPEVTGTGTPGLQQV